MRFTAEVRIHLVHRSSENGDRIRRGIFLDAKDRLLETVLLGYSAEAEFWCFVKRIYLGRSAAGISQPVGF
jgi:hypothetical protein